MKKSKTVKWDKLNARQLAAATAEFDEPMTIHRSRPLNAAERKKWNTARKRGRPRIGRGAKAVSVTIEAELLEQADQLAHKLGLTRAQLIARGLKHVLKAS